MKDLAAVLLRRAKLSCNSKSKIQKFLLSLRPPTSGLPSLRHNMPEAVVFRFLPDLEVACCIFQPPHKFGFFFLLSVLV